MFLNYYFVEHTSSGQNKIVQDHKPKQECNPDPNALQKEWIFPQEQKDTPEQIRFRQHRDTILVHK